MEYINLVPFCKKILLKTFKRRAMTASDGSKTPPRRHTAAFKRLQDAPKTATTRPPWLWDEGSWDLGLRDQGSWDIGFRNQGSQDLVSGYPPNFPLRAVPDPAPGRPKTLPRLRKGFPRFFGLCQVSNDFCSDLFAIFRF